MKQGVCIILKGGVYILLVLLSFTLLFGLDGQNMTKSGAGGQVTHFGSVSAGELSDK